MNLLFKSKKLVFFGMLLSMFAICVLSCENAMTNNENELAQSNARFISSAIFDNANTKRVGNTIYIKIIATGGQEGNIVYNWVYQGSNVAVSYTVIKGPTYVSGSGASIKNSYEYEFTAPTPSGTFNWKCNQANISRSF